MTRRILNIINIPVNQADLRPTIHNGQLSDRFIQDPLLQSSWVPAHYVWSLYSLVKLNTLTKVIIKQRSFHFTYKMFNL